jgi:SPOR domain
MHPFRLAKLVAGVVLVAVATFAAQRVFAGSVEPSILESENGSLVSCNSEDVVVSAPANESPCQTHAREAGETARARAYLIATSSPGYTMTRQGPERAIARLHPAFVNRLAAAIAAAREAGLPFAGIFSAYRPPAFGVGGFIDKFHSLHTYGLAVDITGIGAPGTPSALLWHEIAARHDVICPYGPHNPAEWNHCQPTRIKIILSENPLRETVTADGPISLEGMFEVGNSLIAASSGVSEPTAEPPAHFFRRRVRLTLPAEPRTTAEPTISQPKSVGSWAVLLVGDRSEINALATYQRLSKKHHAILGGYQPVFIHTSLGVNTGAHWHRVRIEANSRAAADALCSKLRAVGGGCLVQRI